MRDRPDRDSLECELILLEILNYSLENYKFHDKCIFIPYTYCSHLRKKRGRKWQEILGEGINGYMEWMGGYG
jgi:hypothetical protein